MTEKANPSINRPATAFETAGAIAYGGGRSGYVVSGSSPTQMSVQDSSISDTSLNAFEETSSGSSFDVTIDAGEAFVFGSWVAKDTATTVSLASSTTNQVVYVGWNKNGTDDVIVGLEAAFSLASGDADQKIPLWEFDTDASGVTNVTDQRQFDQINAASIEQGPGSTLDADTVDGKDASELGSSVSDDGSVVVSSATDTNFGANINVTDDGDDTVTVDIEQGAASGLDADTLDGVQLANIDWSDLALQQSDINTNHLGPANSNININGFNIVDGSDIIWDGTTEEIPDSALGTIDNNTLANSSITVAGNTVSLGSSTPIDHADLSNIGSSDHHTKYTDSEAVSAVNAETSLNVNITGDAATLDGNDAVDFVAVAGDTMSGDLDMGTNAITNLASPTQSSDAATKAYADSISESLDIKESVRVCTETNIDLTSSSDPNPVDGVTLSDGDRLLLKEQTDGTENGIYVATTATDPTTWSRSSDADEDSEVTSGMFVFVESGTTHTDQGFVLTTSDPITLGTTSLSFTQFSGAGSIDAGDGIKRSGNTLNIEPADFAGDGLLDDGSDNLAIDETFDFTFTSAIDFSGGLDTQGNITDGATIIWDAANSYVPKASVQTLDHADLANISSDDHHTKYTDAEAVSAVNSETTLTVDISGDADTVDGLNATDIARIYTNVSTQTGTYTASEGDLVLADTSGGGFTVTLPAASSETVVTVKKTDSSTNTVTVATPGAETIDGQTTIDISSQYSSRDFVSDGTDYYMV